jgi:S1-C subfamily serine protease
VSRINTEGQARTIGLKPGDIILQAQGIALKDVEDLKNQIIKNIYQDSIVLLVQRGRYGYYVTFEL